MININQTSENSKIYIQRNITNDEPVINKYVTEDELQEILKEYNTVPYIVVDGFTQQGFKITNGDFDAVLNAYEQKKPYLIYVRATNQGTTFSLAEDVFFGETYISCTSTVFSISGKITLRIWEIYKDKVELYSEQQYTLSEYATMDWTIIQIEAHQNILQENIDKKQNKLVSGTNIKTINGNTLLGSGDITIESGGNGNIVELTQSEYNGITPEPDTLYVITDAPAVEIPDTTNFVDKETLTYEIDAINIALNQKQDTLVSGQNIKTINNQSIIGSGNITIEGGSGNIVELTQSEYNAIIPDDDTLYLISDSNIYTSLKTINGESIIGEGDIKVEGSVDLTGYATEQWVDDKGYAKLSYVDEQIGNINNVLENIIG